MLVRVVPEENDLDTVLAYLCGRVCGWLKLTAGKACLRSDAGRIKYHRYLPRPENGGAGKFNALFKVRA